jgi:hypothetical protein
VPHDGPGLDVGQRYVVALFEEGGEWGVINNAAVLPLTGDVVEVEAGRSSAAAQALDGLTVRRLSDALRRTQPDPYAEANAELPPTQRAMEAAEQGGG